MFFNIFLHIKGGGLPVFEKNLRHLREINSYR